MSYNSCKAVTLQVILDTIGWTQPPNTMMIDNSADHELTYGNMIKTTKTNGYALPLAKMSRGEGIITVPLVEGNQEPCALLQKNHYDIKH